MMDFKKLSRITDSEDSEVAFDRYKKWKGGKSPYAQLFKKAKPGPFRTTVEEKLCKQAEKGALTDELVKKALTSNECVILGITKPVKDSVTLVIKK